MSKEEDLLNSHHQWPCLFAFKFIVPAESAAELHALLPLAERKEERASSGGKYTAFTYHCAMGSAREVLEIYARVKGIKGLIAL